MGVLIDGQWDSDWDRADPAERPTVPPGSQFRSWITDAPGADHPAENGRYHLYVAYGCPWAHRTLIYRKLKGLEDAISVTVVDSDQGAEGWSLSEGEDPIGGARRLHEVYARARPEYSGRVTVPVLWDKQRDTIVNNESAEIIRMFNAAFDRCGEPTADLYPENKRTEIDAINETVLEHVNAGVYAAGFAESQADYEDAVRHLFETLDELDGRLIHTRYLLGHQPTEADWRLFPTLLRFDPVYHGLFKCNLKRLVDYENLWPYVRDLYQTPGIRETVNMAHIKRSYYVGMDYLNPNQLVPLGPAFDLDEPHQRDRLKRG